MYVGRIVAVGRTQSGRIGALYRVSSRSFPNRQAKQLENSVAILPKPGHEGDIHRNPYIAYNCLRLTGKYAVVSNGSHTDPITEKLAAGYSPRDALGSVLLALDYEHDTLATPRIAAIVEQGAGPAYLGIVTRDNLLVRAFTPAPGQLFYVATYEHNVPSPEFTDSAYDAASPAAACQFVLGQGVFAKLRNPVCAAVALANASGQFELAIADAAPATG